MSETKHTPAPWKVVCYTTSNRTNPNKIVIQGGKCNVARVDDGGRGSVRTKADADLIAAAPDLLAACEDALRYIRRVYVGVQEMTPEATIPIVEALEAAIAKARGENNESFRY